MDGIINVLKPPGMSSNHVVTFIKRNLNMKKVGHCGTLDPGACGVLSVCLGKGTKFSDMLMNSGKIYIAEFVFGKATDTLDSYGNIIAEDGKKVTKEDIEGIIPLFLGEITQIPPMYSAVKINGEKMYKMARKGKAFEDISHLVKKRTAVIDYIKILKCEDNKFLLEISCSKGTYIRTICNDMAQKLGTCGYMSFLLRRKSGGFYSDDSYTLDEIRNMCEKGDYSFVCPIEKITQNMPKFTLDDFFFKMITTGATLDITKLRKVSEIPFGEMRVYCKGEFIGIGERIDGELKIKILVYRG